MTVQPSVEKVIKEFHSAKKPIGLKLKIDLLYLTELTFINSNHSQTGLKTQVFMKYSIATFNQIDNDFAYFFYFHSVQIERNKQM